MKTPLVNMRKLREARGVTQLQVADALDASERTVLRWERGDTIPTLLDVIKLAAFFGVTVSHLLGETPLDDNIVRWSAPKVDQ
jgi:transcriptional regulator with XRE-family HTH domain